jgi:CIC family chloride channel protein
LNLSRILDYLQPSDSVVLGGAALLVGLTSGVGVWLFKQLIELAHWAAFEQLSGRLLPIGAWTVLLLPVVGGLLVGLLAHFFIGEERHHGVAGIMEAVALAGGRLRYRRIPAKSVASAISIGFGAAVGPEDPSVQIGGNLGSMFGQWLRLSDERVRALVAAGAAGGVAAAFNAPIAGVFFALELVLGELSVNALGVVVLASVVSAVFTQAVSGPQPAFRVPAYAFNSPWELPLYLGLGLLAGPIAAIYVRLLYVAHDVFHHLTRMPAWAKPALAGLMVGAVGLFLPQVFGVGYETIEAILGGEAWALSLLVALLMAKLVLTPVSIGGGFKGGVFAPSLFLGATLGGAFGLVVAGLFPTLMIAPPAFALVGMAAVLAGATHAPLTAMLLLFEMTRDYRIILPLMFAVVVSLVLSQRFQRDGVYAYGLARKGIRLERGRDVEVLEAIYVQEVMQTDPPTLHENDSLAMATELLMRTRHHGLPVLNGFGELVGILTVQDIDRAQTEGHADARVGVTCTRELLVAYPDETLGVALRRMGTRDIGRLPVVARDNRRRLLGVLRRTDLVRAYDAALTRRAAVRHRAQQVRLGATISDGLYVETITVQAGAPCANKLVSETAWPRDCVLATVQRGRQVFIPHGNTRLEVGDVLAVVAEGEARQAVRRLCLTREMEEPGTVLPGQPR